MDRRDTGRQDKLRRHVELAHMAGYRAGLNGKATDANPYAGRIQEFAEAWARGWAEAQADLERR